eukprot:jgi/Botrbrau1/10833/Bobra.0025s0012.1
MDYVRRRIRHRPKLCRPGFEPQWEDLTYDLQIKIVRCLRLHLPEFACLGHTSKVFQEVLRERCAEEKVWLESAARAAFDTDQMNAFTEWLVYPSGTRNALPTDEDDDQEIDLTLGEQLPATPTLLSARKLDVQAEAFGLQGPDSRLRITWRMGIYDGCPDITITIDGVGGSIGGLTSITYDPGNSVFVTLWSGDPAQVVACLGLLLLLCKRIARAEAGTAGLPTGGRPVRALIWKRRARAWRSVHTAWNRARGADVTVQRALSALHMWMRCFGDRIPELQVYWSMKTFWSSP